MSIIGPVIARTPGIGSAVEGRSIKPRPSEVKSKADGGVAVQWVRVIVIGRDRSSNRGALVHLSLQVGGHGVLPIDLLFQLADGALVLLDFRFQFRNFITLDINEGLEASRVCVARVIRTFPGA